MSSVSSVLNQLAMDPATRIFFLAPLAFIALDIVTGILSALKRASFTSSYLAGFVQQSLVPYAGILVTFLVTPMVSGMPYLTAADAAKVVIGVFCAHQLSSTLNNIGAIFGKTGVAYLLDDVINAGMTKLFPFVPSAAASATLSSSSTLPSIQQVVSSFSSATSTAPTTPAAPAVSDASLASESPAPAPDPNAPAPANEPVGGE